MIGVSDGEYMLNERVKCDRFPPGRKFSKPKWLNHPFFLQGLYRVKGNKFGHHTAKDEEYISVFSDVFGQIVEKLTPREERRPDRYEEGLLVVDGKKYRVIEHYKLSEEMEALKQGL